MNILSDVFQRGLSVANPDRLAVSDGQYDYSYAQLHIEIGKVSRCLSDLHVQRGDRVGIWVNKSCRALAVMLAVTRIGAVYVPIDPMNPRLRVEVIREDCQLKAIVTSADKFSHYCQQQPVDCAFILVDELPVNESQNASSGLHKVLTWQDIQHCSAQLEMQTVHPDELAYILYTSGSTGTPKGVKITHHNALAFINWSIDELSATTKDRFANHAPWHFDLSVLDIYGALGVGGSVHLIDEMTSYVPNKLIEFISKHAITIWYSVPSALQLMLKAAPDLAIQCPQLHTLIFAGEAYEMKALAQLREAFAAARLYNFYGPTETNVCSFYKLPSQLPALLPIGHAASGANITLCDQHGEHVAVNQHGFITVVGPTVFSGYWGMEPNDTERYNTGDIGYVNEQGELMYVGREDHMVKVKGYRVHLAEVERAIYSHQQVTECVVLLDKGQRLHAHIACKKDTHLSLLSLKMHCAKRLPKYMLPEQLTLWPVLPKNRNGKLSRRCLSTSSPAHLQPHSITA